MRITDPDPDSRMPPAKSNKKLSPSEIDLLIRWIDQGADYEPHWAFSPLQPVEPPTVENVGWVRNPIDQFVLHRLEEAGMEPTGEASGEVLARRIAFGLTGLPPTPEEIDAFVENGSPDAYAEYVENLLGSPHYGERWARHWLDVVRYADSEGYENDLEKPLLYRYRDWVIRSFNDDLPYDTFIRFQIAGDEYEPNNPDAVVATGFMSAGPRVVPHASDTAENKERYYYDELDDIVKTMGEGVLGMTIGSPVVTITSSTRSLLVSITRWRRLSARSIAAKRLSEARRDLELWLETKRVELRIENMDEVRTPSYDRSLLIGLFRQDNASQVSAHAEWDPRLDFTEQEFLQWLGESGRKELARLQASREGEPEDRGWIALDRQATRFDGTTCCAATSIRRPPR